ncbi:hypothetical protein Golomagni_07639 [Golovinomyces magnicellulatus]|nr:hypothetical protein Golomagni_07639 [Golovinomyces magnicellulatus]
MPKKEKPTTSSAPTKPPSWPAFKPPLPVLPLFPEPHPKTNKILTLSTFFPRSLCRDYVAFLQSLPLITTPGKPKKGDAVRVNDRFQIDDPAFAKRLWDQTGIQDALAQDDVKDLWGGEPIGLNPNIRVYRYTKGQFFDCHCTQPTFSLFMLVLTHYR